MVVTACSLAITGQELLLQPVASPSHGLQRVRGGVGGGPRIGVLPASSKVEERGQRRASVLLAISGQSHRGGAWGTRPPFFIAFLVAGDLGDVAPVASDHRFAQHGIVVHLFVGLVSKTENLLGLLSSLGG